MEALVIRSNKMQLHQLIKGELEKKIKFKI